MDDARKKHQYDLYYVKNHSLFLDLLVLIETVSVVTFGEGAPTSSRCAPGFPSCGRGSPSDLAGAGR